MDPWSGFLGRARGQGADCAGRLPRLALRGCFGLFIVRLGGRVGHDLLDSGGRSQLRHSWPGMIFAVADGRRCLETNWERQMTPIPVGWRQRLILRDAAGTSAGQWKRMTLPSGFRRWSETGREQEADRMKPRGCIHADSVEPPTKWSAIQEQGLLVVCLLLTLPLQEMGFLNCRFSTLTHSCLDVSQVRGSGCLSKYPR
jgi:hypothetical protein